MTGRSCAICGAVIAGRADRRFCSSTCRSAAYEERHGGRAVGRRAQLAELVDRLDPRIAEPALVAAVSRAARSDWRAAAWLLERRFPERWGRLSGRVPREPEFDELDE